MEIKKWNIGKLNGWEMGFGDDLKDRGLAVGFGQGGGVLSAWGDWNTNVALGSSGWNNGSGQLFLQDGFGVGYGAAIFQLAHAQ